MSDKRQVTINSTKPNLSVTAWMGADPPNVTAGYGGWEVVARPRKQGLTSWKGHAPYEMDLPILLDGYADGDSVEAKCSAIERMGRPPAVGQEPPRITIDGFVPHSDLTWVVQRITWGDVIRATNGQRTRQLLTLSLLRYIAEDRVQLQGSASKARSNATKTVTGKSGTSTRYTVKAGDTLQRIAQKKLGDSKRYTEIMKLNNIRDPKSIKVNQVLRIPAK